MDVDDEDAARGLLKNDIEHTFMLGYVLATVRFAATSR
jgi:hypothetical protein